ncbi:hypothetical protein IEQ34_025850 [Dendrobium chrysotoxum]|uniref:Uncharacterized protein n=1 Tax=Dendrobium chrysotoxum TaxID=161865 RepID=A0AAV7FN19_DENCH|nr:hypothetical protein IEQ34_025850 [Dendrobium chrysotoxum]
MKGISCRGNHICFGRYALQALEPAWITARQIFLSTVKERRGAAREARSHPSANLGAQKSAPYDGKSGSKDHLFDDVDTAHHVRSDKRNAEEYALGSSPRSELQDPDHRHSLHELIGQDEDPEKG